MRVSARIAQSGASVALHVPDLQAAMQRLREAGARLSKPPENGAAVEFPGSGGVSLELIQQEEFPH
jgi:hypothetical protein